MLTESEKQVDRADRIFEMAMEKPVIVNLAAQSHRAVFDWIERNKLLDLGSEHEVKFCKWFVCSGGYDSINLFTQSLTSYDSRVQHILARNCGICDDWEHVDEDESLQKLIKKYKFKVIDFPKLAYKERNIIDRNRLSFAEARDFKEFGVISKQRVANFLKSAYAAFDSTRALKWKS